jgi:N-acetylneuraminic acid mutarotase
LVGAKPANVAFPRLAEVLPVTMMVPAPRSSMAGAASWVMCKSPRALTRKFCSRSFATVATSGQSSLYPPTLRPVARFFSRACAPRLLLSMLVVVAVLAGDARASEPWSVLAPLEVARQDVALATLGGEIYVIGGLLASGATAPTVEVYDPVTDSWRFAAQMPAPRHHAAAAVVNGRIYVIGGFVGIGFAEQDSVFEYDPGLDAWSERTPLPSPRGALAAAVIDGVVYAVGGDPTESELVAYDPVADSWTALDDMPTPRHHLAAAAVAGRLYAIGGRSGTLGADAATVEEYDPISTKWTARSPMPTARSGAATAVLGDRVFVFGGEYNADYLFNVYWQTESYHPASDAWIGLTEMPTPRHGIGAAVLGDRIHVAGGAFKDDYAPVDTHEVFEPALDCIADLTDSDGDGILDGCDECNTFVAGQAITVRPVLRLTRILTDAVPDDDRMTFRGSFTLPGSASFETLAPGTDGARILVASMTGAIRIDVALPGGEAWARSGSGKAWKYADGTGSAGGIEKMQIRDRGGKSPNRVQVKLKGVGGDYTIGPSDMAIKVTVILGDAQAAAAGACGETAFVTGNCDFTSKHDKLHCR